MRRTLFGAAAAALAMLAIFAVSAALARTSHHPRGDDRGKTIQVIEHATSDTVIDNDPTGDSIGDTLAFGNAVFDPTDTTQVGSDGGSCVRTVVGTSWECNWTTSLKYGQITVEGPFLDAGDSTLAIIGGTGAYAKARGTMDLHARDAAGSAYDFTFHVIDAGR